MHLDKKIVVVTPAGRRSCLKLLAKYILQNTIVDEWHLWLNTRNKSDEYYIKSIIHPKAKVIEMPKVDGHWSSIHKFFSYCVEKDTVYIRIDDDVVWMEHYSLQKLIDFRIKNPAFFLVCGNIVNNAVCDHIHQNFIKAINIDEFLGYNNGDHCGIICPNVAIKKHMNLFEKIATNRIDDYYFQNNWVMGNDARFSINVISWLGEEFAKFDGKVGLDEENWLSITRPKEIDKQNIICGSTLFSHYAFTFQRERLNQTNILQLYENLSNGHLEFPGFNWRLLRCDCDFSELQKIYESTLTYAQKKKLEMEIDQSLSP